MTLSALTATLAAETHHEVNQAAAWGIGIGALVLFLALLLGLVAFGAGREHS